jgi:hypothetical protein
LFTVSRSLALACIAAFALTACGGGSRSSSPAVPKDAAAQHRKPQSVPCTPDSYGYCSVLKSRNLTRTQCSQFDFIFNGTVSYEIYDSTTDLGTYVESVSQACGDVPDDEWSPDEPKVEFGDPNLP